MSDLVFLLIMSGACFICWCILRSNVSRCTDPDGGPHQFQPRYSEEFTSPGSVPNITGTTEHVVATIDALTDCKRTYIHDVCVHCGKIVPSEPQRTPDHLDQVEAACAAKEKST